MNNHSLVMPTTKSLIVGKYEEEEEEKFEGGGENFYDAVAKLQLPHKVPPDARKYGRQPKTSFDIKNKFHMVEVIDLSNFRGKVESGGCMI